MKVYLELPIEDKGLRRVRDAIVRYKPDSVELVMSQDEADLVVIHVYGRRDRVRAQTEYLRSIKKPYVIIQYSIRSTKRPNTNDWLDIWKGAKLVWSYYYLPELCFEDGIIIDSFPFYYSPLGVDSEVFYDQRTEPGHKACVIATCSPGELTEGVRECILAAKRVGKKVFHLGKELNKGDDVFCQTGISDEDLAYYYSCCEFVSGLRRVEGFELPAAEGLLCGARPILFDKPHYRAWYDGLAIFIKEGNREEVVNSLEKVFIKGAKPVSDEEMSEARRRFNWETIIDGFWKRVLI